MHKEALKLFHSLHPGGKAYDYQEEWATDNTKYKLAVKARQIGITTTEAIRRFIECLVWRESVLSPLPPVVIFASPSQRQSNRLMEYIVRIRSRYERLYETNLVFRKEREDYLIFDNHAEIWSLPNNPRTIEGIDASQGIIDEFGNFIGKEDKDIYESMMGSLAAKGGGMTLFGKPRGRRGLFWSFADPFGDFVGQFNMHLLPYHVRARHDKRYAQSVEEHRLRMTPLAFKEQYECEFVDEGVVVMPWELLDRQTHPGLEQWTLTRKPEAAGHPLYMGIDFARKQDETAITLVEDCSDKKTRVRFLQTLTDTFDVQIQKISEMIEHFKPVKCLVDETGQGLPLLDELQKRFASRIEGVVFTQQTKEKILLNAKNLLEEGRLIIPDHKELKEQLHGIEKTVLESGRIKYTGKRTETDWLDDRAWSLFLAVSALGEGDWSMFITNYQKDKNPSLESDFDRWKRDVDELGNPL